MRRLTISFKHCHAKAGLAILLPWLIAASGCRPSAPRSVILISIDTLRVDHLSCYGGHVSTPNIDRLAGEGVRYKNAYAHIPITGPSFASILTSLLPTGHGVRNNAQALEERFYTIAEIMRDNGYRTAGFVSLGVLRPQWGFAQGFDHYSHTSGDRGWRTAGEISDEAIHWLQAHKTDRFFLWLHYSDPHEPYHAPEDPFVRVSFRVGDELIGELALDATRHRLPLKLRPGSNRVSLVPAGAADAGKIELHNLRIANPEVEVRFTEGWKVSRAGLGPRAESRLPSRFELVNTSESDVETELTVFLHEADRGTAASHAGYDREVEYLDTEVGRLMSAIASLGILSDSAIVFTSDHGEGLGEHGLLGHVSQLYNSLLSVPLIIRAEGRLPAGRTLNTRAQHADILPTIADLCGIEPPEGIRGESLLGTFDGSDDRPDRPIFGMTFRPESASDSGMVVTGGYKYIRNMTNGEELLFDLGEDPHESSNLMGQRGEMVARCRALLDVELRGLVLRRERAELAEEEREQLEALGYKQ